MKEILVLSGKGGTGKTTLTAALACFLEEKVLADADVEASNLPLLLSPKVTERVPFFAGYEPVKDEERCQGCELCREKCRFGAIGEDLTIDLLSCEGCGVCAWFCPEEAIEMREKEVGELLTAKTPFGPLIYATLHPGEENSGKLVVAVKKKAKEVAASFGISLLLVDGSPGVGCPVIASLSGADLALLVTEPTLSGLHDLGRLFKLLRHFRIPGFVIINKFDLAPSFFKEIEKKAQEGGFPILGRIPYDEEVFVSLRQGRPLPLVSQGPAAMALREIAERLREKIKEGKR